MTLTLMFVCRSIYLIAKIDDYDVARSGPVTVYVGRRNDDHRVRKNVKRAQIANDRFQRISNPSMFVILLKEQKKAGLFNTNHRTIRTEKKPFGRNR
jgi:hypothetical protein